MGFTQNNMQLVEWNAQFGVYDHQWQVAFSVRRNLIRWRME